MQVETKGKLSFNGGTHPPGKKELTRESEIKQGPVVKQVAIMLSQHLGAVCEPSVAKNDQVQAGQKIGDSDAFVTAPVHSPINGKVKSIGLQTHAVLGRSPYAPAATGQRRTIPRWIGSFRAALSWCVPAYHGLD